MYDDPSTLVKDIQKLDCGFKLVHIGAGQFDNFIFSVSIVCRVQEEIWLYASCYIEHSVYFWCRDECEYCVVAGEFLRGSNEEHQWSLTLSVGF
jgi:hypothetical protein